LKKNYLENGEVLKYTVHHVLLWQMFELVDEVDHVFAHGRSWDAVHKAAILKPGILLLDLFHHLFAKRAHFGGARYCHVLVALVPGKKIQSSASTPKNQGDFNS